MTITKSQLLGVNVGAIRTLGQSFQDARKGYDKAERRFHDDVAKPIGSGNAWKGENVSDATMVAEANYTALSASKAVTESAWFALDGFAAAISHAQTSLDKALADAASLPITVAEDGTTTRDVTTKLPPLMGGGAPQQDAIDQAADRIERRIKGCLVFATTADRSCSGILNRVSNLSPSTTDVADPGVLASNRKIEAGALATRSLAILTRNFWDTVEPKSLDPSRSGDVTLDAINVAGCSASLLTSIGEDATGVGAVLGLTQGVASGAGLVKGIRSLVKDAKGNSDPGDGTKPISPAQKDELLEDAYSHGRAYEKDLDEGGQGYTPDSRSSEMPVHDKDGHLIPYKKFAVGAGDDSHEVIVVDERNGKVYHSDDDGKSFEPIG